MTGEEIREKILIFNNQKDSIKLTVQILEIIDEGHYIKAINSEYGTLAGPFLIKPFDYIITEFSEVKYNEENDYILEFIKNDSTSLGLMYIDRCSPNRFVNKNKMITTQRINSGDKLFNCWWEQDALIFRSGEVDSIQLKLMEYSSQRSRSENKIIIAQDLAYSNRNRLTNQLTLLGIKSETIEPDTIISSENRNMIKKALEFKIPTPDGENRQIHEISFKFKVPFVKVPTVKYIYIWHKYENITSNISARLICGPE